MLCMKTKKLIVRFGTAEPFRVTEQQTGEVYEAKINGTAYVSEYAKERYASEDDVISAIRSNVGKLAEESLAQQPPEDIASVRAEFLNPLLGEAFEKLGIIAEIKLYLYRLTDESGARYRNAHGMGMSLLMKAGIATDGQPKLSDLVPEEHGPLVEIISDYSSHGMAMGSGTSGKESLCWQEDGSVLIEQNDKKNGTETYDKHIAGVEAAEKLRSFVRDSHVAEMAQVKPIPCPFQMTDYSSSSHISFTFEDIVDGVKQRVGRTLDCGSWWELQTETIRKIRELIRECVDTGKCLVHEEHAYDAMAPGTLSFAGLGMMPQVKTPGSWKCACGQENSGKFCINCGSPRASGKWYCPECGKENEGKFCTDCGTPRP